MIPVRSPSSWRSCSIFNPHPSSFPPRFPKSRAYLTQLIEKQDIMFQKDPLAGFGRVIFPPQKALKRETRSLTFDYQRFIGFINSPPHLGPASMKTGYRGTTAQTTPSTQKDCIWLA